MPPVLPQLNIISYWWFRFISLANPKAAAACFLPGRFHSMRRVCTARRPWHSPAVRRRASPDPCQSSVLRSFAVDTLYWCTHLWQRKHIICLLLCDTQGKAIAVWAYKEHKGNDSTIFQQFPASKQSKHHSNSYSTSTCASGWSWRGSLAARYHRSYAPGTRCEGHASRWSTAT